MRDCKFIRVTVGKEKERKRVKMHAGWKREIVFERGIVNTLQQEIANGIFLAEYYIGDEILSFL